MVLPMDNKGVAVTNDEEWDEDELLSLVMDACYKICKKLNEGIKHGINTAWYDNSLLHDGNLCQKIMENEGSLVDRYNELGGLEQFEDWIGLKIDAVVKSNKYQYYTN